MQNHYLLHQIHLLRLIPLSLNLILQSYLHLNLLVLMQNLWLLNIQLSSLQDLVYMCLL